MANELKPCPRCGGESGTIEHHVDTENMDYEEVIYSYSYVHCDCGLKGKWFEGRRPGKEETRKRFMDIGTEAEAEAQAIEWWNTRSADSQGKVEAIAALVKIMDLEAAAYGGHCKFPSPIERAKAYADARPYLVVDVSKGEKG